LAFPIFARLNFTAPGVQQRLSGLSRSFGRLQKSGQRIGRGLGQVSTGIRGVALATAPLALGAFLATKEFASFEKQMSIVKSLTQGITDVEFKNLQVEAKRLGATTSFSAKQAGEGLQFLALAGFTAAEQVEGAEKVLNLAAAGSLDLGSASDIATDSMSSLAAAFDKNATKGERLSEITDKFAFIQSRTNTNVQQLGEAIKFGGGALASFGVPLNEVLAATGALANAGLKGSIGGTALMNAYNKLLKPTTKAKQILKELNIVTLDNAGALLPLPDLIQNMILGLTKVRGPAKRSAATLELFGVRGNRSFLALKNESVKSIKGIVAELDNLVPGEAARQAKTRLNNLAGDFVLLQSASSGALIELGALFGKVLRPILQKMAKFIGGFATAFQLVNGEITAVSKSGKLFFETFGPRQGRRIIELVKGIKEGFSEALTTIKEVFKEVAAGFKDIAGESNLTFKDIGKIIAKVVVFGTIAAPILASIAAAFFIMGPIVTGIIGIFNLVVGAVLLIGSIIGTVFSIAVTVIAFLLSPIGLVVAAIVAIGVAAFIFRDELFSAFNAVVDFLAPIAETMLAIISAPFKLAFAIIKPIFLSIGIIAVKAFNLMKKPASVVANFIGDVFTSLGETIKTVFSNIKDFIKGIFNGITNIVNDSIKFITAPLDKLSNILSTKLTRITSPTAGPASNVSTVASNAATLGVGASAARDVAKAALSASRSATRTNVAMIGPPSSASSGAAAPSGQPTKQIIENKIKIILDGKTLSEAVAVNQVELDERRGATTDAGEKRIRLQKGAIMLTSSGVL